MCKDHQYEDHQHKDARELIFQEMAHPSTTHSSIQDLETTDCLAKLQHASTLWNRFVIHPKAPPVAEPNLFQTPAHSATTNTHDMATEGHDNASLTQSGYYCIIAIAILLLYCYTIAIIAILLHHYYCIIAILWISHWKT